MSYTNQVIVIGLCYLVCFLYFRGVLFGIKRYQLNKSAYKKRKKGETFVEWLLISRFFNEIPKALLVLYFVFLLIHPIALIACTILYFLNVPIIVGKIIALSILFFDNLWVLVIVILFWGPRDYKYERWITKKRGQKPKEKRK